MSAGPEHDGRGHVGLVLPNLGGGGAERATLALAGALIERGWRVDLMLLRLAGRYRATIPSGVRLWYPAGGRRDGDLLRHCRDRGIAVRRLAAGPGGTLAAWRLVWRTWPLLRGNWSKARGIGAVARYLREARPQLLFAALPRANNVAVLAAELGGGRVPVIVSIRNNPGLSYSAGETAIARRTMKRAQAVVAVSRGVAADAVESFGLDARRVHAIWNPVPAAEIRRLAEQAVAGPWFDPGAPPVVLTVLREAPQKDWATLVAAFGRVRRRLPARLVVLGRLSERYRARIVALARTHGVEADIVFPGFDENPWRYMRRAAVFVLSSRFEGLPNVLVEALACGTPAVSTDTPFGPAEILEDGRWGRLTPVGDAAALADAILETLTGADPVPAEALMRRADAFSAERSAAAHEALFETLIAPPRTGLRPAGAVGGA